MPLSLSCLLVLGLYKEEYFKFLNVYPFDYIAFAVSAKVGIPLTGLTTPVGLLSSLQLTVLIRCIIELSWWRFCVVTFHFGVFCGFKRYSHRTESDLFPCLLWFISPPPLAAACFCTFWASLFNFLNYFVLARIIDEGLVQEMRWWYISLLNQS